MSEKKLSEIIAIESPIAYNLYKTGHGNEYVSPVTWEAMLVELGKLTVKMSLIETDKEELLFSRKTLVDQVLKLQKSLDRGSSRWVTDGYLMGLLGRVSRVLDDSIIAKAQVHLSSSFGDSLQGLRHE